MKAIHNAARRAQGNRQAVFKEQSYDSFSSLPVLPPLLPVVVDDEPHQTNQTDKGTLQKHILLLSIRLCEQILHGKNSSPADEELGGS